MFSLRRSVTQFCPWQCLFYFSLLVWFSPFVLCISSVVSKSLSNPLSIMYFWVVSLEVLCFLASVHFVLPEAKTVCAFFLSSFLPLPSLSSSFSHISSFPLFLSLGIKCHFVFVLTTRSSFLLFHLQALSLFNFLPHEIKHTWQRLSFMHFQSVSYWSWSVSHFLSPVQERERTRERASCACRIPTAPASRVVVVVVVVVVVSGSQWMSTPNNKVCD